MKLIQTTLVASLILGGLAMADVDNIEYKYQDTVFKSAGTKATKAKSAMPKHRFYPFDLREIAENAEFKSVELETDSLQYEPRAALVADQQGLNDPQFSYSAFNADCHDIYKKAVDRFVERNPDKTPKYIAPEMSEDKVLATVMSQSNSIIRYMGEVFLKPQYADAMYRQESTEKFQEAFNDLKKGAGLYVIGGLSGAERYCRAAYDTTLEALEALNERP